MKANIPRAVLLSVATFALLVACNRRSHAPPPRPKALAADQAILSVPAPSISPIKPKTRTMYATWYDVPDDSLAARRAANGELTAAHNGYRIGARLRVTHPANGRSVIVRVTDRGVPRGKAALDICKRAAEELDMLREGTAKVRVELLPEEEVAGAAPGDSPSAAAQP